jgi:hypothetical protein
VADTTETDGRINLFDGEEAVKFGCVLDDNGEPLDNIYFQTLELLQEYGYDIEPLRGKFSDQMFWADHASWFERIIEEFELVQKDA